MRKHQFAPLLVDVSHIAPCYEYTLRGEGESAQEYGLRTAQGGKLFTALHERFAQHPYIGDILGRGLFQAIEWVEDRETKTPFDPERGLAGKIKTAAFEAGLICYPMPGTRDGREGDHVLLAPPFIIKDAQIEELVNKLSKAVAISLARN